MGSGAAVRNLDLRQSKHYRTSMPRSAVRFAAIWPKNHSVHAYAIFEDQSEQQRKFDVSIEAVKALSDWLMRDEGTQIVLLYISGIGFPWAGHPQARTFDFSPGGPTFDDWVRFRSEHEVGPLGWFQMWQPILLSLGGRAAVLLLTEGMVEALPAPKKGRRDPAWLADTLRSGGLRWAYPKDHLNRLCERLLTCEPRAVEECVAFLELNSRGHWHNRARAKMARRLKHCSLSEDQQQRATQAILRRLDEGDFTEQYRDQLKLALHLDPEAARAAAERGAASDKEYVRHLSAWLLEHS